MTKCYLVLQVWEAWDVGVNGKPSMKWLETKFPPGKAGSSWRESTSRTRGACSEFMKLITIIETYASTKHIRPAAAAQQLHNWQHLQGSQVNSLPKLRDAWNKSTTMKEGIQAGLLHQPTPMVEQALRLLSQEPPITGLLLEH